MAQGCLLPADCLQSLWTNLDSKLTSNSVLYSYSGPVKCKMFVTRKNAKKWKQRHRSETHCYSSVNICRNDAIESHQFRFFGALNEVVYRGGTGQMMALLLIGRSNWYDNTGRMRRRLSVSCGNYIVATLPQCGLQLLMPASNSRPIFMPPPRPDWQAEALCSRLVRPFVC